MKQANLFKATTKKPRGGFSWQLFLLIIIALIALAGCTATEEATTAGGGMGMGRGMGMGDSGMMARHQATIPSDYAGLTNPIAADEASLERGAETYTTFCTTCHGDGGMGDGPASAALDPAPAPLAHTGQMMGDDYLFWRVAEGGAFEPFNSGMPAWKDALDENQRWDVINYIQALGQGTVVPRGQMGGATFDPEAEAARHAEMAAQGVEQGLFTQAEADTFVVVHAEIDTLMATGVDRTGNPADLQATLLAQLVDAGTITAADAATFNKVHDGLMAAGIMQ